MNGPHLCPACEVSYVLDTTGVWVIEFSAKGTARNAYRADRYKCPQCTTLIVTDFGAGLRKLDRYAEAADFERLLQSIMREEHYFMRQRS